MQPLNHPGNLSDYLLERGAMDLRFASICEAYTEKSCHEDANDARYDAGMLIAAANVVNAIERIQVGPLDV